MALHRHKVFLAKFNLGLLPNYLFFVALSGGFGTLLALRMDGYRGISLFIILIPLWFFFVYVIAFLILVGLASKNKKIRTYEKVLLALVPPLGFITSGVLALCKLEGHLDSHLWVLFMPELLSALFLYLYVRCLLKPSGTRVQSEPQQ